MTTHELTSAEVDRNCKLIRALSAILGYTFNGVIIWQEPDAACIRTLHNAPSEEFLRAFIDNALSGGAADDIRFNPRTGEQRK